ncbi:unnamed protein product, partial [Ixodes pacificus]
GVYEHVPRHKGPDSVEHQDHVEEVVAVLGAPFQAQAEGLQAVGALPQRERESGHGLPFPRLREQPLTLVQPPEGQLRLLLPHGCPCGSRSSPGGSCRITDALSIFAKALLLQRLQSIIPPYKRKYEFLIIY